MRFEKSHFILLAGFITVSVTVGSNFSRTIGQPVHPAYTDIPAILAILASIPALLGAFVAYGLIFGLPFISTFLIVKHKYLYAGIGSVILGLFWFSPIINNATSYAPLSWIGVTGVGLVSLCHLGTGLIALAYHFHRQQLPALVSYVLCGILLTSAFPIPIDLILYWTTTSFGYM